MGKWNIEETYQEAYFQPRYYEVDANRNILIPCMLRYMQETALRQIIRIGLSYWDMQKYNVTWIFRRGQLNINRLPKLGQKFKSLTYANSVDKFLTYRDFKIMDKEDNLMASLVTEWVLLDYKTKKICRIEDTIGELPIFKTDAALKFKPFKIKPAGELIDQDDYRVRKYDLDFNGHTNNASYSEWVMESLPEAYTKNNLIKYNIHFKQESLLNDHIIIEHREHATNHLQHTVRKGSGEVLCLAESWFG